MSHAGPVHLRPHEPVAERVVCPGDPGRALRLAQDLLEAPRMLNHHRGLWGYSGIAPDGSPLTVQATGIGGPSAAAVLHELAGLGARRVVRVGTAVAVAPGVAVGDAFAIEAALAGDGASRARGAPPDGRVRPDADLDAALAGLTGRRGIVWSVDLFYPLTGSSAGPRAEARDLQTAALLAAAARLGLAAGALCLVTRDRAGRSLDDPALHAAELRLGRLALAALG